MGGAESGDVDRRARAQELVGQLLAGRFEVLELLGMGSFGEVYQVRDRHSPSGPLAIKLLRHASAHALYRFKREFRALVELAHPNVAALHELFLENGQAFFTMELVAGVDFLSYVRPGGPLSPERLLTTLNGLCEGVSALHAQGRLHRDLKPSNVLVEPDGRVVIVDFGLATLFERNDLAGSELGFAGTAQYAAPEQLMLGQVGPESDWYAVGTMLFEALSGALPFEGPFASLIEQKSKAVPALPELSGTLRELRQVCLGMLHPDMAQRSGSSALRALLGQVSVPPRAEQRPPFVGRKHELAQLHAIFERVERGSAAVALVLAPSGLGKTTLVDHFIEQLRASHRAIVLRSRCYVNEELAYRAVDGGIDALSHYLCSLPPARVAAVLPRDARSLASIFPVLSRVAGVASAPVVRSAAEDRASLRERAGAAMRELLARLSDRLPLVLFIDDIQWDDPDSAWLLSVILADPDPPAMLLVASCRAEAHTHSHILRALQKARAGGSLLQTLELPALSPSEAQALALHACVEARDDPAVAVRIAVESGGHPLFALELARWAHDHEPLGEALPELSLDAAIRSRALELPAPVRRLLEVVCVAGHPLAHAVAARAAGCEAVAVRELVARRLVTSSGSAIRARLEVYHDRVREAVLPALAGEHVCALHAALAGALAADAEPRSDLIVEHYLAAGQPEAAARHALAAADYASEVLAFHRVPELLLLAMSAAQPPERGRLGARLAEAYALVGRNTEATRAYQDAAAAELDPERCWELRSLAMWQALQADDYALGVRLLRELDAPFGLRGVRPTFLRVTFSVLRYFWSRVWGLPKLQASAAGLDRAVERKRLRLAFRAATGVIGQQARQAAHLAVVAFRMAARLGDAGIYASFLSLHAVSQGLRNGRRSARSERLLARAAELVEVQPDDGARVMVVSNRAIYAMCVGDYEHAERELSAMSDLPYPLTPFGTYLRLHVHQTHLAVLFWLGRMAQARVLAARVLGWARELADPRRDAGLRASAAFRALSDDDAEGAWAEWSSACERYPMHRVLRDATWGVVPALYAGRLDHAEQALAQSRRLLMHWDAYFAPGRAMYLWWWGAVAAARLAAGERSTRLRLRLKLAGFLIGSRPLPFFEPFALSLRAAQAMLGGRTEQALEHLQKARDIWAARGLRLVAACASQALAGLHPDERMRGEHAAYAREVFAAEKISHPEKWQRVFLPGMPVG